jgi:hypothetical protein
MARSTCPNVQYPRDRSSPSVQPMKTSIALLILMGLTVNAWAEEEDKGFYAGAGVGQFNVQADDIDDIGPIVSEFDSESTSFKIFGGWRFNRFLAAEVDYIDFGSADDDIAGTTVDADLSGIAPYVVGTFALGPVELFAKLGYLFYDLELHVAGADIVSESGTDEDLIYGVGAGIVLFERLQTRLEYEIVDVSETIDDADALWLSAAWRF